MFQDSVNHQPPSASDEAAASPALAHPTHLPSLSPLRIGLIGLGTVGAGTYRVLVRNQALIAARTGRNLVVTHVAVRNTARATVMVEAGVQVQSDPFALVKHPDIDVVVEAMGGTTLAKDLVLQAIAHGKHVVTANKALLAEHGTEVFAAAQARGVIVAYEGAVAVSIPIIKALREGLVGNRVEWVAGIINGTSNFILSEMQSKGMSFDAALRDAQAQGFAEADPRFDVEGIDAAHKLSLLAANAFGTPVMFDQVHIEGITHVSAADMASAAQMGYRIKLLGVARQVGEGVDTGISLSVRPTLVPADHWLGQVADSMNGILVRSDAAGDTFYYGAGAGSEQTASAVVADLVDVARNMHSQPRHRVPYVGTQAAFQQTLPVRPVADQVGTFYVRLHTSNTHAQPILDCLVQWNMPVRSHGLVPRADGEPGCALLLLIEGVCEARLRTGLQQMAAQSHLCDALVCLPVEDLA